MKCIQNIKFQFPVPIIKDGKEVAKIKGISLDKEKSDEHMVTLEKLSTLETVCLLSKLHETKQKHEIIERENYNKPKSEKGRRPECPKEKEIAIEEALKYFQMIPSES